MQSTDGEVLWVAWGKLVHSHCARIKQPSGRRGMEFSGLNHRRSESVRPTICNAFIGRVVAKWKYSGCAAGTKYYLMCSHTYF